MLYCRPQSRRRFCDVSCSPSTAEEAIAPAGESKTSEDWDPNKLNSISKSRIFHSCRTSFLRSSLRRIKSNIKRTALMTKEMRPQQQHSMTTTAGGAGRATRGPGSQLCTAFALFSSLVVSERVHLLLYVSLYCRAWWEHGRLGVWSVAVRTPLALLDMVLVGPVEAAEHYQWLYSAPVEVAESSAFRIQRVWYALYSVLGV